MTERRRFPRFFTAGEAAAVPLAADGGPAGPAFRGVLADLSSGGLRVLHTRRVAAALLAVRLGTGAEPPAVVIRVARLDRVRSHYEYAGPFLAAAEPGGAAARVAAFLD